MTPNDEAERQALVAELCVRMDDIKKRKMKIDQPAWVCADCGDQWGNGFPKDHLATWHQDKFGVCEKVNIVTETRNFRYLKKGWKKHG